MFIVKMARLVLLNDIKKKMIQAWLVAYSQEIDQEITDKISKIEAERAVLAAKALSAELEKNEDKYKKDMESYSRQLAYYKTIDQTRKDRVYVIHPPVMPPVPAKPKMITKHGYTYAKSKSDTVDLSYTHKASIKKEIIDKYQQEFIKSYWEPLHLTALDTQIDKFDPKKLLDALTQRHPWLAQEFNHISSDTEYYVTHKYIYDLLSRHLLSLLNASKSCWENLTATELISSLTWSGDIDADELKAHIEGYPLAVSEQFFLTQRSLFPNLQGIVPDADEIAKYLPDYQFSRVDVFRILKSVFDSAKQYDKLKAKEVSKGLFSTKAAPLIYSELQYLSSAEVNYFETLVINLRTEKSPLWTVVNKENGIWIAYVSEEIAGLAKENLKHLSPLEFSVVDYSANSSLNNIDFLTDWQAVVFSRILPWCAENSKLQSKKLADYRNRVPLPLLMQKAMEDSKIDKGYFGETISKHFVNRQPFTYKKFDEEKSGFSHVATNEINFSADVNIDLSLEALDKSFLTISEDRQTLRVSLTLNKATVIQALNIIYHNTSLSCLELPHDGHGDEPERVNLFNLDVNIKTVRPTSQYNSKSHNHPLECAARNRFLESINNKYLNTAQNSVHTRKKLWDQTGEQLTKFFRDDNVAVNLDFVNEMKNFNNEWTKVWCEHSFKEKLSSRHWQFVQISQMGFEGLNALFQNLNSYTNTWKPFYKEPAPALHYAVDVTSSLTVKFEPYIRHLSQKIHDFGGAKKNDKGGCAPLFQSFSLILPEIYLIQPVLELIDALNARKKVYENEIEELVLYNLDINNANTTELLKNWKSRADSGCLIFPHIPAWDREVFPESSLANKNLYRAVQNKVKDNLRNVKLAKISSDTQCLYVFAAEQAKIPYENQVDFIKSAGKQQIWSEADITYPLSSQAIGIQQQLQQQVAQQVGFEAKQKQEVEQEFEYEQAQQIVMYGKSENGLITRNNVDANDKAKENWNKTTQDIRDLSGWESNWDLKKLFSLWVGSAVDAAHVIEKMEAKALQKIMQNAAKFRLGISTDNLPPGFFLRHSTKSKGLILCFSSKQEKEDLYQRECLAAEENVKTTKRNPFTVELHQSIEAEVFSGDYRQFEPLSARYTAYYEPRTSQTLWKYLATEDKDVRRIENGQKAFGISENYTSDVEQRYTVEQLRDTNIADGYESCLLILNAWASKAKWQKMEVASEPLRHSLFKLPKSRLTEKNLKALGQLFNAGDTIQQDGSQKNQNATLQWLFLANQIYTCFGSTSFSIWKSRLLDSSNNWTEFVEKKEVDAVVSSIKLLKDNSIAQKIWWKLVDAHGKACGSMRYSELWDAYKAVFKHLKNHESEFDVKSISQYLEKTKNFNGLVFLDRLYRVLKNASKRNQIRHSILKNIIQKIDLIDWRHNGFYYASVYEQNPEWYSELCLTEFHPTVTKHTPGYQAHWDTQEQITDFNTHALRFVMQHMPHDQENFDKLIIILNKVSFNEKNVGIGRLLIACIILESEKIENLTINIDQVITATRNLEKVDSEFINWLNRNLKLETATDYQLSLRYEDMAIFANVITKLGLQKLLNSYSQQEALLFINACGRALQCFKFFYPGREQSNLEKLLNFHKNIGIKPLANCLLTDYPWLIADDKNVSDWINTDPFYSTLNPLLQADGSSIFRFKQTFNLKEQLRSISFSTTNFLPSWIELKKAYCDISSQEKNQATAAATRLRIVSDWKTKGCNITHTGGQKFRKLNNNEKQQARSLLSLSLTGVYVETNLKLFSIFIKHCAVPSVEDNSKLIKKFISLLAKIDNKNHYNELAPVLALLISKSKIKGDVNSLYAMPQLIHGLRAIQLPPEQAKIQHYAIALFGEVLDELKTQDKCSLLNKNIEHLNGSDASNAFLLDQVGSITKAELPNQYKPSLVKMAIESIRKGDVTFVEEARKILVNCHKNKISPAWLNAVNDLLIFFSKQDNPNRVEICTTLARSSPFINETLKKLYQEGCVKQINLILKNNKHDYEIHMLKHPIAGAVQLYYIRAILMYGVNDWTAEKDLVEDLVSSLKDWPELEIEQLAIYFSSEPNPTLEALRTLIQTAPKAKSASCLIHQYETVSQGLNSDGTPKRHYSITDTDQDSINRVLRGFKQKGQSLIPDADRKKLLNLFYYINAYSQVAELDCIDISEIKKLLHQSLSKAKNQRLPEFTRQQAMARVLACMREILLRKSGKWANHTQMIAQLYAALNNDDSMIHQVRTGQGKSILTIMRVGYLALNGKVVDVFSSKDSLSQRDHKEFAPVLDAMGIPHGYIPASGEASLYKTKRRVVDMGAVNYATIGNLSLFQSSHIWVGDDKIDLSIEDRVAYIDEADAVLTDQTQFNHSDNRDNGAIYNLDEWVYRIAFKYYKDVVDTLEVTKEGAPVISRNIHLKKLCELIQAEAKFSPKESRFLQKFIIPALTGDDEQIDIRDQQLKLLLSAAYRASGLKEGSQFCVRPAQQIVAGGMVLRTRFAKVMIDNQVKDGSTYSDLVQQFLHVRLNEEAAEKGEMPDFFVEPESQIALSLNAVYFLKKYYHKIEGCTGTAGNNDNLKEHDKVFGIKKVIKLPPHEEIRTEYLPPVYSENEDDQIYQLTLKIIENAGKDEPQPILIPCADDIAVKRIFARIEALLLKEGKNYSVTCDTNDAGRSEAQVVPGAGRCGAITISARLGRGTDIKPESRHGLMVLRTYIPKTLSIEKQEHGRQGRNGAPGTCGDFFDYGTIQRQYILYKKLDNSKLDTIFKQEEHHLNKKLTKYKDAKSVKWDWTNDTTLKTQYLTARSVQRFKYDLEKHNEKYIRQKEYLIATLSGAVMDVLHDSIGNMRSFVDADGLKEDWLSCRTQVEADWNSRLAGKDKDSDDIYEKFFEQANHHWKKLCSKYNQLDELALVDLVNNIHQLDDIILSFHTKTKIWKEKLENHRWEPKENDLKDINDLNKEYKKLLLANHPDKYKGDQEAALKITKDLTPFKDLYKELMNRGNIALVPEQNSIPQDLSALQPTNANALVTVANGQLRVKNTQDEAIKNELNAVIGFYQQWISGAQTWYFGYNPISKDLKQYIYRKQHIDEKNTGQLDQLFKRIYKVSNQNNKLLPLSYEQQIEKRTFLFQELKAVFNKPAAYIISCGALAEIISNLVKPANIVNVVNNTACVKSFFEQTWMQRKNPSDFSSVDFEKHERLLKLTMNIVSKSFVNTNGQQETLEFIQHFGKAIHDKYWLDFDSKLAKEIESIFAYNPQVVTILTKSTNHKDIDYFIKLIIQNSKSVKKDSNKLKLLAYLTKNVNELDGDLKGVVRPLFTLTLGFSDLGETYLPENPNILPKIVNNETIQNDCWNFLAERPTADKSECEEFIANISSMEAPGCIDPLKSLFKLPSVLPLSMINKKLEDTPGRFHFADFEPRVASLKIIGEVFNQFLLSRGISSSSQAFSVIPAKEQQFKSWVEQLKALSYKKSELFFTRVLKEDAAYIPFPALETISKHFQSKDIEFLNTTIAHASKFYNHMQDINFKIKQYIEKDFLDTLKNAATNQEIANYSIFIEKIKKSEAEYITVREDTQDLRIKAYEPLYHKFIKDKSINSEMLEQALSVVNKAIRLHEKNDYTRLFYSFTSEAREERQTLMQYLQHGLVNLGSSFADKCNNLYQQLAEYLLNEVHTAIKYTDEDVRNKGIRSLQVSFHKIICFTRELSCVNKHPILDEKLDKKQSNSSMGRKSYREYFKEQEKNYSSFWFINTARAEQANKLFDNLKVLLKPNSIKVPKNPVDKGQCYHHIIKAVLKAQNGILDDDKNTNHNEKGYSRLYDITMQMLAKVAHDCVRSNDVSFDQKQLINKVLHKQLVKVFQTLIYRLPDGNLKTGLCLFYTGDDQFMAYDSVELTRLSALLKTSDFYRNIPKNLRYLADNLTCLTNASEEIQEVADYGRAIRNSR